MQTRVLSAVDLFSGAGGMSYGFHKHPGFRVVAAADAEMGKRKSSPMCNEGAEKDCKDSEYWDLRPTPMRGMRRVWTVESARMRRLRCWSRRLWKAR